MKLKDITPGYYAVGNDNGFAHPFMDRVYVIGIGKWKPKRYSRFFEEGGKTRKVLIGRRYGHNDGVWTPDVVSAQMVWGPWEEWVKESQARSQKFSEDMVRRGEARQQRKQKAAEIHTRLLNLGFERSPYDSDLPGGEVLHLKIKWWREENEVQMNLELLEKFISLIEAKK